MTHSFEDYPEAYEFARANDGELSFDAIADQWIVTLSWSEYSDPAADRGDWENHQERDQ